jgi:dihydrodipicolinate synthase/N-acetylneuraminate lyase
MVKILKPYGVLAADKSVMSCRGVDCGPVRPPLCQLSEPRRRELLERIEKSELLLEFAGGPTDEKTR